MLHLCVCFGITSRGCNKCVASCWLCGWWITASAGTPQRGADQEQIRSRSGSGRNQSSSQQPACSWYIWMLDLFLVSKLYKKLLQQITKLNIFCLWNFVNSFSTRQLISFNAPVISIVNEFYLKDVISMCILGIIFMEISSSSFSSPASGILASVETCMSDLCSCERALVAGDCEGKNIKENKITCLQLDFHS